MAIPLGWGQNELDAEIDLANRFGANPEDILALWNSESGLFYRCGTPNGGCSVAPGYFGLIQGYDSYVSPVIGASWKSIVANGSLLEQIAAIKKFWEWQEKQLGEPIAARAARLGVIPSAVLYSLNFVPAYFRNMKTADQPMIVENGGPDGGAYYHDNPGFDIDQPPKGYITVRDVERRILNKKSEGLAALRTRDLFLAAMEQAENPYATVAYRPSSGASSAPKTEWGNVVLGVGIVGLTAAGLWYAIKRSHHAA